MKKEGKRKARHSRNETGLTPSILWKGVLHGAIGEKRGEGGGYTFSTDGGIVLFLPHERHLAQRKGKKKIAHIVRLATTQRGGDPVEYAGGKRKEGKEYPAHMELPEGGRCPL